jgi:hypothetical protein
MLCVLNAVRCSIAVCLLATMCVCVHACGLVVSVSAMVASVDVTRIVQCCLSSSFAHLWRWSRARAAAATVRWRLDVIGVASHHTACLVSVYIAAVSCRRRLKLIGLSIVDGREAEAAAPILVPSSGHCHRPDMGHVELYDTVSVSCLLTMEGETLVSLHWRSVTFPPSQFVTWLASFTCRNELPAEKAKDWLVYSRVI